MALQSDRVGGGGKGWLLRVTGGGLAPQSDRGKGWLHRVTGGGGGWLHRVTGGGGAGSTE